LVPGTEGYNDIPLVVNGLDQVLAYVKDSKAAVKTLPPKSKSQDPPQVKDHEDVFDEDSVGTSDNNNQPLRFHHPTSRSRSKEPMLQTTERMPYRIVDRHHSQNNQSSRNELDSLIPFGSDDLPEIALENEAQLTYPRHDYQQLRHIPGGDSYLQHQDASLVHGEQSYRVPHRGEMGGQQYRQLVVDTPKDGYCSSVNINRQPEQKKPSDRLLPHAKAQVPSMPPAARPSAPSLLPPMSKARIPSMPPPTLARISSMPPTSKARILSIPPIHASTRASIHPSMFYGTLAGAPSARVPPPNHPSTRIPPQGHSFNKGKEKARVHSAKSNFLSHIRQDDNHAPESHRFFRQRQMQDGQAGPSKEVYLTQEDQEDMEQRFYEDAYANVEYEDEEDVEN